MHVLESVFNWEYNQTQLGRPFLATDHNSASESYILKPRVSNQNNTTPLVDEGTGVWRLPGLEDASVASDAADLAEHAPLGKCKVVRCQKQNISVITKLGAATFFR